jgi:hypothetical protein
MAPRTNERVVFETTESHLVQRVEQNLGLIQIERVEAYCSSSETTLGQINSPPQ